MQHSNYAQLIERFTLKPSIEQKQLYLREVLRPPKIPFSQKDLIKHFVISVRDLRPFGTVWFGDRQWLAKTDTYKTRGPYWCRVEGTKLSELIVRPVERFYIDDPIYESILPMPDFFPYPRVLSQKEIYFG